MDWFEVTGRQVDRWWTEAGRDEARFPDVAMRAVTERPPGEHVDVDALVRQALDPGRRDRQFAPPGAFGQPGYTAWHGGDFVIDVYFWTSGLAGIHDHPFCGLFTILRGFSVHAVYRFDALADVGPSARLGRVALARAEVLGVGAVRLFSPDGHPLIHALVHVQKPSLSLVLRTTRTEGYHRYVPPSLALRVDAPDPEVERRLMLLDHLAACGDPTWEERLGEFVASHPFGASFDALWRAWPRCSGERFTDLVERGRATHGDAMDAVTACVERGYRRVADAAVRDRFDDPDDRFVATVLALAETRATAFDLLRSRFGPAASDRLAGWIDRAGPWPDEELARRAPREAVGDGFLAGTILEPLLTGEASAPAARAPFPAVYDDADWYDLLATWKAPPDGPFWSWIARNHPGPILEIGVGTGRVAVPLAVEGHAVTGLDASPALLDRARERAAAARVALELHQGDMRGFDLGRRFGLVIVPYHTFHHLLDVAAIRSFFAAVRRHLLPEGALVVDAFQPSLQFLGNRPEASRLVLEGDDPRGVHVRLFEENHYDPATQVNRVRWKWEADGAPAGEDQLAMRIVFPQELDVLFALGGFDIVAKWGDHDRNDFGPQSPQQIVVARVSREA